MGTRPITMEEFNGFSFEQQKQFLYDNGYDSKNDLTKSEIEIMQTLLSIKTDMTADEYIENVILKVTTIETVEQIKEIYIDDKTEMQDINAILQMAQDKEYNELETFIKNHSEIYLNFVGYYSFNQIKATA